MTHSKIHLKPDLDHILLEEFVKELETTTTQVQSLLQDIRESEIEFATIKTELRIFIEHVKDLSSLIKEGDGGSGLLTRIALVEKSVGEIETWIRSSNQEVRKSLTEITGQHQAIQVAEKAGKWQLITAIATGVLALITSTITLLLNLLGKH